MSSFWRLLIASRISPSEEINSVYIKSAPASLHTALKGGSLTSSMGASSNGKSGSCILPIVTILFKRTANLQTYLIITEHMQYRSAKGFTGWGQTGILVALMGAGL